MKPIPRSALRIRLGKAYYTWRRRLIGKPTKRKGYVEGMVLFYGRYKTGIGGGLSQLSNMIYWLTHAEISGGVIHSIQTQSKRYLVGTLTPWHMRP